MAIARAILQGLRGMRDGYVSARQARLEQVGHRKGAKAASVARRALVVALVAGGVILFAAPQLIRVQGLQPPIRLSARKGVLTPFVLQVKNDSDRYLTGVKITCKNLRRGDDASFDIDHLNPRAVVELGGLEWNWAVGAGDSYTVSCEGYLPIVFNASQLGLK